MQFRLLHRKGDYLQDWYMEKKFASIYELFDYDPDTASWFRRHPKASYYQYDHGNGLHWKYEVVD